MNKLIAILLLNTASAIASDWQPIFDGKILAGWHETTANKCWNVQDGLPTSVEDEAKPGSNLETEKTYKDFILEAEARWNDIADSGFLFRADQRIHVNIGLSPSMKRDMTASLYLIKAGGYVAEAKVTALLKPGGWNKFKIELRGSKITVWLSGEKVMEHEQDKFMDAGPIGLQVHKDTPGMKVEYQNLRVMEL